MEIAAGDDLVLLRKDQGIVGNGVDLPAYRVPHIADGVPAGPVDLRGAANGVGILDLVRIQGEGQPAALQQAAQVLRRGDLPGLPRRACTLGSKAFRMPCRAWQVMAAAMSAVLARSRASYTA